MVKAVVFSIGEPTTYVCCEALERQGVKVDLYKDESPFADKYKKMLDNYTEPVLRVDADIIVNSNLRDFINKAKIKGGWCVPYGWLWWSQDYTTISVNYLDSVALSKLREVTKNGFEQPRPERKLWCNPDTPTTKINIAVGLKGYGVRDLEKTKRVKAERKQSHDWKWIAKLNRL